MDIPQEELASVAAAATLLDSELPAALGRKIETAAKAIDRLETANDGATYET